MADPLAPAAPPAAGAAPTEAPGTDAAGAAAPTTIDDFLRAVARAPETGMAARVATHAIAPGQRIAGRFDLLSVAGRGGMGTVFRARDRRDKRNVALKVLATSAMHSVARFEREAAILAGIRHPNVVAYVAHGATPDGAHYLVMDWVDGEDLHARLRRAPQGAAASVAMAVEVARALGALHASGVVHRDLKPSNLMLGEGDRVTLVDFGVARRGDVAILTRTGTAIGTVGYMAPEQVRGVRELDGRADLFALGCILHECLTGQPAFAGPSPLAARARTLLEDPVPIRALVPELPAELEALVLALLARDPARRPSDAAAVARALLAIDLRASAPIPLPPPVAAPGPWFAQMVAWRDEPAPEALAPVTGATIDTIEGGLVLLTSGALDAVADEALALAARFPRALIALAGGADRAGAIDASAALLEDLEATGAALTGAWIDRATAARLGDGFAIAPDGDRARIVRAR
ncbi:MAG: serine/threonine protein kinase [Deltaproteobacteria bacterium]|nr:serine/threonine protein kinase [Deltaproteobacteria bacterium]